METPCLRGFSLKNKTRIFPDLLAWEQISLYTHGVQKQFKMTQQEETMHIAKTILNQIKYADRWALMAWGAKNFAAVSPSKEFQGGLSFQVNGLTHKGWVTIKLRWVDDYTIIFTNRKREVVKTFEGAFCDMLVPVIDWIEGK